LSCAARGPHYLMLVRDDGARKHWQSDAPRQLQFVVRQRGD
jgi:hypothetical protein